MNASSESPHHSDCEARLIVENMPGFAWSADQDGKLRYLNQRFLEYTGKRIEDFNRVEGVASLGRTDVLHPEDVADTVKAVAHSVATGDPYAAEHRVRRFDGTYRWFRASAVRIRDPMSQEIGWYGVDIDIDDQKRTGDALRQSEQSLNHLIETLPAMVWRATPDGEPEYINSRLANYTGRGLDGIGRGPEDVGRTLEDLVKLKVQNAMVHQDDLETAAQGALLIGEPDAVAEKIIRHSEALGGISRITFQMNAASLPQAKLMQAIEALGTRVAPALRKEFAGD
jgi:PAS domain S-box-containing protein